MILYHWRSEALANYAPGHIVAMAEDVEAGRVAARSYGQEYVLKVKWWHLEDGTIDPDFRDDHDGWWRRFEKDIAAEPTIVTTPIFITGSE